MPSSAKLLPLFLCLLAPAVRAASLEEHFQSIAKGFPGRVGVCAIDDNGSSCLSRDERFSLQSIMKLIVVLASLDAVDRGSATLHDSILVRRDDLSLYVQPIADLVGPSGYRTTVADLMRRAIVDSDSAASDILMRRLGGPPAIALFLKTKNIPSLRLDRDERHLQTEIVGLSWQSLYVEPERLRQAIAAVPSRRRTAAWNRYRADVRDTSTPFAMARLLQLLANEKLLSPSSTRFALDTLAQTVTFPDRLKGGLPPSWLCMHKTGTSGTWDGVTVAINDVGILRSPQGRNIAVAVFLGDVVRDSASHAPPASDTAASLMRRLSAAIAAHATSSVPN